VEKVGHIHQALVAMVVLEAVVLVGQVQAMLEELEIHLAQAQAKAVMAALAGAVWDIFLEVVAVGLVLLGVQLQA
jgi:CRISPR/Cas system-associated protein Csm6